MLKMQGYIAPHGLIRKINFIIVMSFPGLVHRQGFDFWNIKIICHNISVDCCVVSFTNFTLYVELVFVLFFFLLHLSLPVIYHVSALIYYLIFYWLCWMFERIWWQTGQTYILKWPYLCLWQSLKYGHDLMQKKTPLLTKSIDYYNKLNPRS